MPETIQELISERYGMWKRMSLPIRAQTIGIDLLGLSIDLNLGKITEPTEDGGTKITPLPAWMQWEKLPPKALDAAQKLGWTFTFKQLPRESVMWDVRATKGEDEIICPPMPKSDGILFTCWIIGLLEGDNG